MQVVKLLFKVIVLVFIIPVVLFPFLGGAAKADPQVKESIQTDCAQRGDWNYCVHRFPGKNPNIIYYIHGYGDSTKIWIDGGSSSEYAQELAQLRKLFGENSPTVVSISYSSGSYASWLLSVSMQHQKGPQDSTIGHFANVAIPEIEKTFGLQGQRILYGMSMGGFNAAQLCLHYPTLWNRCIVQNALLVTCNPFSGGVDFSCISGSQLINENYIESEWSNNDPMAFAKKVDVSQLPPLFISGATNDQHNFFKPDKLFAKELKNRGARVEWHELQGDHLFFDPSLVYEFITR